MKIHHINCAHLCPHGLKFLTKGQGPLVCHCLLIESDRRLILIDSGFCELDIRNTVSRLGLAALLTRPQMNVDLLAKNQIKALGFSKDDVTDIVLTHLDLDHAGGILDFPNAKAHIFGPEYESAFHPGFNLILRQRYKSHLLSEHRNWVIHEKTNSKWQQRPSVDLSQILDLPIQMVPITGHTKGHCMIATQIDQKWLVHCGDAYFHRGQIHGDEEDCPPGLLVFETTIAVNYNDYKKGQAELRDLAKNKSLHFFSAHDPVEFQRLSKGGH